MIPTKETTILDYFLGCAVKKCTDKGKKVAVQLSGGLDSALIQTYAHSDYLYCCTWPEEDNLTSAMKASNGRYVEPVTFTKEQMIEALPRVKALTNGQGTWSQVCQWFMCKKIAKDGCDVVLTGEGADELFYGYARYRILWHLENIYTDLHLANYEPIIDHMFESKQSLVKKMLSRVMDPAGEMVGGWTDEGPLVQSLAAVERMYNLPQLLEFGQAMANDHGIRCEFPFMNPLVVNFADEIPMDKKINDKFSKAILRDIAADRSIDSSIIYEITKKGLFVPQTWRPKGECRWSRKWFEKLMKEA